MVQWWQTNPRKFWHWAGRAWQPTFKEKEFDEGAAIAYLQTLGNIGEYSSNLQGPDYFSFYGATQHRPPTTPGNDCISYGGWLASGDVGIACMMRIDDLSRKGGLPPAGNDYNTSTMSF